MGWIMNAAPGSESGPCTEACKHTDCAAIRAEAQARCRFCGEPIGFDTKFYRDPAPTKSGFSFIHFVCALKDANAKRTLKDRALAALNENP